LALVILGAPVIGRAAGDCPGVTVDALPYEDSGSFPMGSDDFDVSGLAPCGLPPLPANGPDFVLNFLTNESPDLECTLTATNPVLAVFGGPFPCDEPGWIETFCYEAEVGTEIVTPESIVFFGLSGMVVDALGNPDTTFTLTCDGVLPVELLDLTVD
jgi:hypothetical protein